MEMRREQIRRAFMSAGMRNKELVTPRGRSRTCRAPNRSGPAQEHDPRPASLVSVTYATGLVGAIDTGTHVKLWRPRVGLRAYGLAADYIGRPLLWITDTAAGKTLLLSPASRRRARVA